MDELFKIITPQNFAMVVAIYLLVRFEKTLSTLENNIEKMDRNICSCIERNTRVLGILIDRARKPGGNSKCDAALRELTVAGGEDGGKNEFQIGI